MKKYLVEADQKINLEEFDPGDTSEWPGSKSEAEKEISRLAARLDKLQQVLYAEHEHKILVVLQGMDTSGKDGTIRRVFDGVNPQGVQVAAFKQPSLEEMDHDFLWRIHAQAPGKGRLVIFNRSHYEDVLIVRVHKLVPEKVWKKRYDQINEFERILAENGTTILKFCLWISKDTQKKRLQARLDSPKKQWKFNPADLKERDFWGDYTQAYQDAVNLTSTKWAPWVVVPSDHTWYRDLVVAHFVVKALEDLNMSYPEPSYDPSKIVIK